jgi:hypothetical protein
MQELLAALEEQGISSQQLQQAGFTLPPPRVDEENRWALYSLSVRAAIRGSPSLQALFIRNRIGRAIGAPRSVGEWWSMACVRAGAQPDGRPQWVITVVDSTRLSRLNAGGELRAHPDHKQLLDSETIQSGAPPSIDEIKSAVVRAIVLPEAGGGPPPRPELVCIAWDMRHWCAALEQLGQEIGVRVKVAQQGRSVLAEDAQFTCPAAPGMDLFEAQGVGLPAAQGVRGLPADGDPFAGEENGAAATKKKKKKKKKSGPASGDTA